MNKYTEQEIQRLSKRKMGADLMSIGMFVTSGMSAGQAINFASDRELAPMLLYALVGAYLLHRGNYWIGVRRDAARRIKELKNKSR